MLCVLTVVFIYVNFRNLNLASQMQFSLVMHILNNSWCDSECTEVCCSVCLVRYTREILLS